MHRIATISGGWNQSTDNIVFVDQEPAPIVIITAADTDIQTLAAATAQLSEDFPQIRVVNLLQLVETHISAWGFSQTSTVRLMVLEVSG